MTLLEATAVEGVATLTLARPERGNALSEELVAALTEAVTRTVADDRLHTLVLRGQGPHFCTGFDLSDLATSTDGELLLRFVRIELLLALIWQAPIRTVAIASGRTWGAGADLFAACDVRASSPDTTFRFPGARFGLVLGTRRLAERIGSDLARRCTVSGMALDTKEAQHAGLVTDALAGEADEWLSSLETPVVDRLTMQRLHSATRPNAADADIAALVRSAAEPGLKERISSYRAASIATSRG